MLIEVKDFTIIPKNCPAGFTVPRCDSCSHATKTFALHNPPVNNPNVSFGYVDCHYTDD
jgi:hypothetical protein